MRRIFALIAAPFLVALFAAGGLLFLFSQQQQLENDAAKLRLEVVANEGIVRNARAMSADLYNRNPEQFQKHKRELVNLRDKGHDRGVDKYLAEAERFRFPDTTLNLAMELTNLQQIYGAQHLKLDDALKENAEKLADGSQLLIECLAAAAMAFGATITVSILLVRSALASRVSRLKRRTPIISSTAEAAVVNSDELAVREQQIQQLAEAAKAFATQPPEPSQ